MPSPIGHSLAGAAIGFMAAPPAADDSLIRRWRYPLLAGAVAALPDADLLIPHFHRSATHSLFATASVFILTIVVTRQVTAEKQDSHQIHAAPGRGGRAWGRAWRLAATLALAHASHLLLDWLGTDHLDPSGIELLWPFSGRFYISNLDWFPPVERRLVSNPDAFWINLRALVAELAYVGPFAWLAWWLTRRRRSRVPTSDRDSRPTPSA